MRADFSNDPIDVESIPRLHDEDFSPVDANYLKSTLIGFAIWVVVVIVAGVTTSILVPRNGWVPLAIMGAILALTAFLIVMSILGVKNLGYQVREHDLSHRHGVLFKTVETVPFVRVQHARVTQGPIERLFGISKLAVNSAGPDLHIPGLAFDDAERLRAIVVERAGELSDNESSDVLREEE